MGMKADECGRLYPVPGFLTEQIHSMIALHPDDHLPNVEVLTLMSVRRVGRAYLVPILGIYLGSHAIHCTASDASTQHPRSDPYADPSHPVVMGGRVQVKEYAVLLDSSDMGPSEWAAIAIDIRDHYQRWSGATPRK